MPSIWMLIALFFAYSVCGWIIEGCMFLINDGKFVNRGFLVGPCCPIYGVGSLIMILTLQRYVDDFIVLFVMCVFICGTLEYFTSYIMEKLFKARWWDYSEKKFQINGRICLETLVQFGLGGLFIMYAANPLFTFLLSKLSLNVLQILDIILMIIFLFDVAVSFRIIYNFKSVAVNIKKDSTDEISKKVRNILTEKSKLTKRLVKAFPDYQAKIRKVRDNYNEKLSKRNGKHN